MRLCIVLDSPRTSAYLQRPQTVDASCHVDKEGVDTVQQPLEGLVSVVVRLGVVVEAVGDGLDVLDEEMVLVREEDAAEDEDGVAVVGEG